MACPFLIGTTGVDNTARQSEEERRMAIAGARCSANLAVRSQRLNAFWRLRAGPTESEQSTTREYSASSGRLCISWVPVFAPLADLIFSAASQRIPSDLISRAFEDSIHYIVKVSYWSSANQRLGSVPSETPGRRSPDKYLCRKILVRVSLLEF